MIEIKSLREAWGNLSACLFTIFFNVILGVNNRRRLQIPFDRVNIASFQVFISLHAGCDNILLPILCCFCSDSVLPSFLIIFLNNLITKSAAEYGNDDK